MSDAGGAGVSEVHVTVAGRILKATVESGTWRVTLPKALANGTYNVQATATDLAGNVRTDSTRGELKVDTRPPVVQVNRLTTRDNTPTLSGTVYDRMATSTVAGSGIASVTIVVGGQTLTATVNGSRWSVTVPSALVDGKYNVRATATDRAGNTATDTTAGELIVDTVAPVVTINSRTVQNNRPTLSGTVTDAAPSSGLKSVRVTVGNQSFLARVQGTTWTAVVPRALANGTYDVRVVATDMAGNVGRDATTNELVVNVPAVRSGKQGSSAAVARAAAVIASQSGQASGTSAANDRDTQAQLIDLALASYPLA